MQVHPLAPPPPPPVYGPGEDNAEADQNLVIGEKGGRRMENIVLLRMRIPAYMKVIMCCTLHNLEVQGRFYGLDKRSP